MNSLSSPVLLTAMLAALPAAAWAGPRPDFDADAKPILHAQPHLLHYIRANFDVEETGYARTPGDENHAPPPPYIFRARHHGAPGPDTVTLLIQPGPPGHILMVKDDAPGTTPMPPPSEQPAPPPAMASQPPPQANAPAAPAAQPPSDTSSAADAPVSDAPTGPTADTPSGPIKSDSSSASPKPNLAPPPDPAP
jgi:hypothetical protein